uniref:Helix-loop-helix protein delilah n=1 Tax=Cacopsylla melanoneura TaxID=428564 RepID=A0A8D9A5V9_9HEMI
MKHKMALVADLNNNSNRKAKSYSLRPRSGNKKDEDEEAGDFIVQSLFKPRNKIKKKPKQKPPPLSKYRRKTANARERHRMKEINDAFETLRQAIPSVHFVNENVSNEKMTKITTLKLAMNYISALSQTLRIPSQDDDADEESLHSSSSDFTWSATPDVSFSCLTSSSDQDHSLTSEFLLSDSSTTDNFPEFPLEYSEYSEYSCDFPSSHDHEVSSFLFDTDFS